MWGVAEGGRWQLRVLGDVHVGQTTGHKCGARVGLGTLQAFWGSCGPPATAQVSSLRAVTCDTKYEK